MIWYDNTDDFVCAAQVAFFASQKVVATQMSQNSHEP
jgi:hypothetical protein